MSFQTFTAPSRNTPSSAAYGGGPPPPQQSSNATTLLQSRARFNASRSFDYEDDLEFCPSISDDEMNAERSPILSPNASPLAHSGIYQQHNHQSSPLAAAATIMTSTMNPTPTASTSNNSASPGRSGLVTTPPARVRKVIDIVDPSTGMRISSSGSTSMSTALASMGSPAPNKQQPSSESKKIWT